MRFDLIAESAAGLCVLADQEMIGTLTADQVLHGGFANVQEAGSIFTYEMGANCPCKFSS